MADRDLWRKNLPEDFDGRHADEWDGEIPMKPVYWSTVAIVISVVIAFIFNALLADFFYGQMPEPYVSPIAEANERRLPPTPVLQPKPEMEMEVFRETDAERMGSFGWVDELDQRVHIPIDRAMELVLTNQGTAPTVEPAEDAPVDVPVDDAETAGEPSA